MTASLEKLALVLTRYAQGGPPGTIPKVHFHFTCDPVDISVDGWALKLVLEGYEKLDENGDVVPSYEQSWEATGINEAQCVDRVTEQLQKFLQESLRVKISEQVAMEGAIDFLTSDADPVEINASLWGVQTTEDAHNFEVEEEKSPGLWTPGADESPEPLVRLV